MRLAHHRDSKPLLPDSNLLSLGEVSCLDPYEPPLGALLAQIHWLLLFTYAPATFTLLAWQPGWFLIGSGVSSRLENRLFWGLLLSCPQNTRSPLFSSAACTAQASPSSGNRLLRQAQPGQVTGQELLPASPPCSPSYYAPTEDSKHSVASGLTTRSGHYGPENIHLK